MIAEAVEVAHFPYVGDLKHDLEKAEAGGRSDL